MQAKTKKTGAFYFWAGFLIPTLFALAGGFYHGLGAMMLDGVKTLAPTGVMLTIGPGVVIALIAVAGLMLLRRRRAEHR